MEEMMKGDLGRDADISRLRAQHGDNCFEGEAPALGQTGRAICEAEPLALEQTGTGDGTAEPPALGQTGTGEGDADISRLRAQHGDDCFEAEAPALEQTGMQGEKSLDPGEALRETEGMRTFLAGVDGFARGSGIAREEIDAGVRMLLSIANDFNRGTLGLDALETVLKGLAYDRRMEEARGRAAEECAKAEERGRRKGLETKLRATRDGDGVPVARSRGGRPGRDHLGIFTLAASAR